MTEPRRRGLRLRHYDYASAGWYFVTVCTAGRVSLFGEIVRGAMQLNEAGRAIAEAWTALPARFPRVDVDAFVVMPNHLHGILAFEAHGEEVAGPPLGEVVGAFKSVTTVEYGRGVRAAGWSAYRARLWQRNYFEHVIRDERSLEQIRQYIIDNPLQWDLDHENPAATATPADRDAWDVSVGDE